MSLKMPCGWSLLCVREAEGWCMALQTKHSWNTLQLTLCLSWWHHRQILLYFVLCYAHVIFRLGLPAQLISWTANISQWDLDVAWRTMQATVEGFSSWSWRGFVCPFFLSVLSSSICESSMLLDFHLSSWQDRITVILLCQSISSCWDKFLSVCCLFHSHLIVCGVQWTFPGQWGYRLVLFISS